MSLLYVWCDEGGTQCDFKICSTDRSTGADIDHYNKSDCHKVDKVNSDLKLERLDCLQEGPRQLYHDHFDLNSGTMKLVCIFVLLKNSPNLFNKEHAGVKSPDGEYSLTLSYASVCGCSQLSPLIYFTIWTNIVCILDKYIWQFGQIYFACLNIKGSV